MAGHWTDNFIFATGVVRRKDLGYLVLNDEKLAEKKSPHASFVSWKAGQWGDGGTETWSAVSAAVVKHPLEQFIAIGENGEALLLGSNDRHVERIADGKTISHDRGTMRCVRAIGGKAYAVGMDRQVYRRDDLHKWTCIDTAIRPPKGRKEIVGFEGIDGFSEREIFVAGWKGEIWMYDGKKWAEIDSPTNLVLTSVCCGGDGSVYAAGRRGLLVKGRKGKWETVRHESTMQDLWGMAWYKDELYLSSLEQIFVLRNEKLEPIEIGDDKSQIGSYHLSSADGVLWSIGPKDVMAYDGKTWARID